ncbi:SdrD B-like domain-containing protein [Psychroflexus sediminis]|uniref:C-terminal domain of CHU protein family protein n=1 Tax=Psychroflexus sediminis TaxID=470826 RepID=A0A1G7ZAP7_9FLAO|nr:SdrD B-like domain-containing protein [Psychroflexus sediminis]SDH05626.1 C-terminal domain of CHU protein family protein [Psychroflexus sediminis]
MRITTSSLLFLVLVIFQGFWANAQEGKSYLPNPFVELMQKLAATGVVEGLIYADFNANGTRDTGEPGLEGVRVIIVNSNGNGQTTPTNADGRWSAEVIEGNANLIMDLSSLSAGYLQTEGSDPSSVQIIANDTVQAETKGFTFQGDASGHLYSDTNGNGVQDSLEIDLPDVDVLITDQYGNTQTVITDSSGDWLATVLFGPVEVNVDETDADFPTGAFQTEGTNPSTHSIPSGEETFTENDGFFESGILSGIVYFDENGTGNQDSGEPGIANIPVEIRTSLSDTINLATDAAGNWSIRVPAGTTESLIDENAPGFPTGASQTEGNNPTTTEVVNGQTYEEFDGFLGSGILRGHLYFDEDGNGVQDIGEADMPDVDVEIIDSFGNVTILVTDVNGDWSVEVPAGNTFSNIDQQDPDFPQGAVQTEGTDPTLTQVIAGNDILSDIDGFFETDPELEGTLSGHLYSDTNGNGTQDAGEPNLPNIDVQITDTFGEVTLLETDANGDWSIVIPSGTTTSDILQSDPDFPVGAVQTEGTDPTITFVPADTSVVSDNDGFFSIEPSLVGVLQGHLYFDSNGNGVQDVGEPDMPNVDVEIIDVFGDVTLLETDVNGDWSIEVPAGNTFSNIDQQDPDFPTGATQTEGTDPSLTFVVADETTLSDLDGFFIPDANLSGTLVGHLYFDTNANGNQEIGEPDLANVDIEIIDVFGDVSIIESDVNGDWSIEVPAGNTFSNIDQQDPDFPAGAIQTEGTDPTLTFVPQDDTVLSDNDGFFLTDPNLLGTLSGHLYLDANGNGIQNSGELDLSDIEVLITDVFGNTSTVVTNANGNWSVEVPAGNTVSDINQQDANFPQGAVQTDGTDPTTTFVNVGNTTFSEDDGFFVPTPDTTGNLLGHLYFDDNGNGTQDSGEPDMPNVDVEIIDVFGVVSLIETDVNGDWSIEVPAGNTFSNIDQQDPDFPTAAIQTEGTDPSLTFVIANASTQSDKDGYFIQDPNITGSLSGHLYFDNNSNGVQDNNEPDMPNVLVQVVDGDGISQNLTTDINGNWTAQVAEGSVISTIDVEDSNFPQGATQTQGNNPTTTQVSAGDDIAEEADGFFTPNQSGTLSGIVYEDQNNNSTQDNGEPGIEGVEIEILESDGVTSTIITDANGEWFVTVSIGNTTSTINTNGPNFPQDAVQTQGTNPTISFVGSNANVSEVPDGYFIEEKTGILTGRLYFDDNGNSTQDGLEEGISNVSIRITDSSGSLFETETESNGDWSIEVIPGQTLSEIDKEDPDFPENVTQTEGTDPTTTLVISGETVNSDNDGFLIDGLEIFNAIASEGSAFNNTFFRIKGIENYPNNSVQIFNRQGVKVFDVTGYDNDEYNLRFNGYSEGNITIQKDKRLPTGTYFYILNYVNRDGEPIRKNGYLHLN